MFRFTLDPHMIKIMYITTTTNYNNDNNNNINPYKLEI